MNKIKLNCEHMKKLINNLTTIYANNQCIFYQNKDLNKRCSFNPKSILKCDDNMYDVNHQFKYDSFINCVNKELYNYSKHINIRDLDFILNINKKKNNYDRFKIFSNDHFEMVFIVWGSESKSLIHDHCENGCITIILEGSLCETKYKVNSLNKSVINNSFSKSCSNLQNNIENKSNGCEHRPIKKWYNSTDKSNSDWYCLEDYEYNVYPKNSIMYIDNYQGAHCISNNNDGEFNYINPSKKTISLHIYSPPNYDCKTIDV